MLGASLRRLHLLSRGRVGPLCPWNNRATPFIAFCSDSMGSRGKGRGRGRGRGGRGGRGRGGGRAGKRPRDEAPKQLRGHDAELANIPCFKDNLKHGRAGEDVGISA